jgi:hypothetical protein
MDFLDENTGVEVGYAARMDAVTLLDHTPVRADLGTFLERPVRIATFTWAETDAVPTIRSFAPWQLFFNDARIKYKLNNYSFIQCDLKVKVMINASPFYYGAMIMSYQPLPILTPSTIQSGSNNVLLPYSQRPHAWIYPQANEGCDMTLPFFYNKNWLRIQHSSDFSAMGLLSFINYTQLASANGVTGQGVTVQVYAWAENVRVAGPSVGLALQSQDEYGTGPVSKPASAIAAAAGKLTKIPIIKPFATATQMGMMAISGVASLFGFTNTPVIEDVCPLKPVAFPPMSTSEIGYPVEKLTMDPKNELSIDPGVVNLASTDEMAISYLAQKESFLCSTTWSTTQVADTILFTSQVLPQLFAVDTPNRFDMVPMCWLANMFNNWRGDIIFRFRVIATPFHKGRLRISYDPTGYASENIISDPVSSTVVFTQIIDLGKDSDVEIRIPYQQALGWLSNYPIFSGSPQWSTSASPTFLYNDLVSNGTIMVRVLTSLSAPVATAPVQILVSVRAADNFELANPVFADNEAATLYTTFPPQSMDEFSPGGVEVVAGGTTHAPADDRYLVNFGESIQSMRQYLRRSSLSAVRYIPSNSSPIGLWSQNMTKYPLQYGYDPGGLDLANKIIGTGATFFNWTFTHPLAYFIQAFVGTRGSVMWHFNSESFAGGNLKSIRAYRNPGAIPNTGSLLTHAAFTDSSTASSFYVLNSHSGDGGQAVTTQVTQGGLSVLMPNYSNFKFQSTSPLEWTAPATINDSSGYEIFTLEATAYQGATDSQGIAVWEYASIGTDFNVHFFLNVPTYYIYSTVPTPV